MAKSRDVSRHTFLSRFRLNALSYGYAQLVTLFLQLVLVPVFLKYWGTARYADWLVLTGLVTLLTLLDLGVAQASINKATVSAGANDWSSVRKSLHTALAFTLMLGCFIVTFTLIANQLMDWQSLLNLRTFSNTDAETILLLMSLHLFINLLGGPLGGYYRVIDRTALGAFLIANRRMVDAVITVVVLVLGKGPIILTTMMVIGQVAMLMILIIPVKRYSPYPIVGISETSWLEFRSIMKPAIAYMSFPLSQAITIQGGVQVLNQLADASVLVGFVMARTLMRLIIQLGVVSNNALKPEISRLAGQENMSEAYQATIKATRIIIGLSVVCYILGIVFGPQIIEWWGHGTVHAGRGMLALVGIHAVMNVAWFVPAALLIATNNHVRIASAYAWSSIAALFTWFAFSSVIPSIIGASMLLALPELIVLILFYMQKKHHA